MSQKTAAKIDFKKYRTPELFEKVSELINLRGTIGKGFYQSMLGTFAIDLLISLALCMVTYFSQWQDWRIFIVALIMVATGFPLALPGGIFYAIAYLVRRSIDNMLSVIDLLLETTKTVATDINAVRSGESQMPSPKELVRGVYLEVFLPIIEKVITDQLSILAKPTLFLYRLTFGRLMRLAIKILPERALSQLEGQDLQASAKTLTDNLETIADNEATIVVALDWTQKKLRNIGRWATFTIMLPCYMISGIVVMLSILALIVDWLFVTFVISSMAG